MPLMIVSLLSLSYSVWNVGSSFWNRCSAFEKFISPSWSCGLIASEITVSGTYIDDIV